MAKITSRSFKAVGFIISISWLFLAFLACDREYRYDQSIKRNQNFDFDWRFQKGDFIGAEINDFNDSNWRRIDLPHDWSIEDLPEQDSLHVGPFSVNSVGAISTGYTVGGTGWYRKPFFIAPEDKGKRAILHFDGAYMESEVWVNGQVVGFHPNGYTPFYYDITSKLKPVGEENILAIKVINEGENSRWYSGSGIYRSVQLSILDPVHINVWGVYITTPEVSENHASVNLNITVKNNTDQEAARTISTRLLSPRGATTKYYNKKITIPAKGEETIEQTIAIDHPNLWSPEETNLYTAELILKSSGKSLDNYTVDFGIRSIEFSAKKGFLLNGNEVLMKGACMHHDNGLLGAAAHKQAEIRRVKIMKANGYNAIRTSHNPPSAAFLEACDRLGMLVIDESFDMWVHPKKSNDYHRYFVEWWKEDLRTMILRDRNHPSVVIWSIGNEIYERGDSLGLAIAQKMTNYIHSIEPSRPVTQAICHFWEHPGKDWNYAQPAFEIMDVSSYNYQWAQYENDHVDYPERVVLGSESFALEAFENWDQVTKHSWVVGDFVWTGMDYLGEAAIGHSVYLSDNDEYQKGWPSYIAWCGDIDIIGNKKPQSYYRDVVWDESKLQLLVHTPFPKGTKETISNWGWPNELPSWNWEGHEGELMKISVYSRYPLIRLMINDQLVAEKQIQTIDKLKVAFTVPYQKGELKAFALKDGRVIDSVSLITTGPPESVLLNPERNTIKALKGELAYIKVLVTDSNGSVVPNSELPISVTVKGCAGLIAAGSGAPDHVASFQQSDFSTFRGNGLVILKLDGEPGDIEVMAESPGLKTGYATIKTR